MIVSVFGASGRTGHAFVRIAAEAGLLQRLHYRNKPSDLIPDTATVVVGALADPTAVREVLRGADAVVIVLGPRPDARGVFCATATKAIIAGMRTQGVPRVLCVTGAMIGELPRNVGLAMKLFAFAQRKTERVDMLDDRDEQERLVRNSKLAWTVVKPPRLTDGTTAEFDAAPTLSVGINNSLSREALAAFLVREVQVPQFASSAVYIKDR